MLGAGHYNARAIFKVRLLTPNHTRHQPPVSPMDVAFLVPEA